MPPFVGSSSFSGLFTGLFTVGSFLFGLNDGLGTVGSDPVGVLIIDGTDVKSVGARGAEAGAGIDTGVEEIAAGTPPLIGAVLQPLVGIAVGVLHVAVVCSLVINAFVAEMDVHRAAIKTGRRVLMLRSKSFFSIQFLRDFARYR